MSDTLRRIRELCGTLGSYAENLEDLRTDHPLGAGSASDAGDGAPLWGGTVGARPSKLNGASFWFDGIEPLYAELDELIRYASGDLFKNVFCDQRIRDLAPEIHRVRAAYERDKELVQARNLVDAEDARARLERMIEQEGYWALGEEMRRALDASRHVLVAGSGPLPLTALCIGATLDTRVTCVESDAECHALAMRLIATSGIDAGFECINADILELTAFDDYDAIVGVVLLGVGAAGNEAMDKKAVARHIVDHMSPGTRLVLRDPHGLGILLYPPVDLDASAGLEVTRHVPEVGPDRPYRSGLVIAERRGPDTAHAH